MTKEQEEAIKRIKNILNMPYTIEKVGHGNYSISTIKHKLYDDIDIKVLLDMLEENSAEIEKLEKQISDLKEENLHWRGQYHLLSRKINVIPVEKVKDVLQRNKNELFSTTSRDLIHYRPYEIVITRINKIEKELLEDNN